MIETLKRIKRIRKEIRLNSLIHSNKNYENEIKWLHGAFLSALRNMEYELEYIDEFNVDLNSTIQSVVDWYETDEVHPI